MKYLLSAGILLAGLSTQPLLAQSGAPVPPSAAVPKGSSRLTGLVLDAVTQKPVEYATVALLPAEGDKPLDGAVADDKGRFVLRNLAPGGYRLQLSFLGYGVRVESVTVGEGSTDLGALTLSPAAQKLGEVTVTGERETVEVKPDRLVYNADRDLTNAGGTAADVLRKVPLVSVDPSGNLELRGSANVRVLINNKPSGIIAGSVADALKQLPADQIKTVEVITTPSAKYDAEGTAGIINIILKKNNLEGTNGNVGLAVGNRSSNGNLSLNTRRGKLGLNSSVNGWGFYGPNRNDLSRTQPLPGQGEVETLRQEGSGYTSGGGGFGRLGLDYDPAANHSFTLAAQGNLFRNSGNTDQLNDLRFPVAQQFIRSTDRRFHTQSYDVSAGYTHTWPSQPRREWSVLGQHTRNRNTQDYDLDQRAGMGTEGPVTYRESSANLSRNLETTLQTDYAQPFGETRLLEAGAKAILRRVSSDYDVLSALGGTGELGRDASRSNLFAYEQDVQAAYATYGFGLGAKPKVNFRLGSRLERTAIVGRFEQGQESRFTQDYTNLLPNLSVSYAPGKPGQTLRLAYSRRIQRPQIFFLNPFVNRADSLNISYGNPTLEPELTNSYELNYSTFVKGSAFNASLYVRQTNNAIEAYRFVDERGVNNTTYRNIGRNGTYGLSLFGSVKPTSKWDLSGNVNTYYVQLSSPGLDLRNDGVMYSANLNSSYRFTKKLSLQFFGGFNSDRVQLQGYTAGWVFYGLGIKQLILKEKGDLTLNADNFLANTRNLSTVLRTPEFDQTSNNYLYLRGVRLAFNYRFGKVENRPPRARKSIRNDDTKQGDGQGQGQ